MLTLIRNLNATNDDIETFKATCAEMKGNFLKLGRLAVKADSPDFAEAYTNLYLQVAEIESEVEFAPVWFKNEDHKKLTVLNDKLVVLSRSIEMAKLQTANFVCALPQEIHNISELGQAA